MLFTIQPINQNINRLIMKKILLTAIACFLLPSKNLIALPAPNPILNAPTFLHEIIHNKEYEPFLLTYSNPFYSTNETGSIPDENIENWLNASTTNSRTKKPKLWCM